LIGTSIFCLANLLFLCNHYYKLCKKPLVRNIALELFIAKNAQKKGTGLVYLQPVPFLLKRKHIGPVMTLSPATAAHYVDTCNLSAANTHYTYYNNLRPTVKATWESTCNLTTANTPLRYPNNLGLTEKVKFPYHNSRSNCCSKLAHPQRSGSNRHESLSEPITILCSTAKDPED